MLEIKDKWALVTGSSRGFGKRVATSLAEKGCRVILHSRTLSGTKHLLKKMHSNGHTVCAVAAELSNIEDVKRLIKEVKTITDDHLDILYNNAAIMTPYRNIFEPTYEEYQHSFLVNSIIPAKLCDAFLPGMLSRNWGRIVNVTSKIKEEPQLMPYSCSKPALDRYVRDMISTLQGTNVLMNLLDPDWLRTDLGRPRAPNHPDSVLPGALIPIFLEQKEGSGKLYKAQDYRNE